jgi:hypothetical protein
MVRTYEEEDTYIPMRRRIHRYFYSPMVRTERKMGWLRVEG